MKRIGLMVVLLVGCHRDLDVALCEHNPAYCADAADAAIDGGAEVEADSATADTSETDSAAMDTATGTDSDSGTADLGVDATADTGSLTADTATDSFTPDTATTTDTSVDSTVTDTGFDASADTGDSAPVDTCVCAPGEVAFVVGTCPGALERRTKTCTSGCIWGADSCAIPKGWTAIANPPATFQGRLWSAHIWTGGEVIIHGGRLTSDGGGAPFADGAIYDLKKNTWTSLATTNAPAARAQHAGVWFGFSFLVWGGRDSSGYRNDGAIYDAFGKTWDPLPAAPLTARANTASIFIPTTSELFIWGGDGPGDPASDGAVYSTTSATWTKLPTCPLTGRAYASVGWTGSEVLVWGGLSSGGPSADGALFDPVKRTWRTISAAPVAGRIFTGTALTSAHFAFFAGSSGATVYNDGAVLDLPALSWRTLPTPSATAFPARSTPAFWQLGNKLYLWSGVVTGTGTVDFLSSGASFDLIANSWSSLNVPGAPSPRVYAMVQNTGGATVVWSGIGQPSGGIPAVLDDGAVFVP